MCARGEHRTTVESSDGTDRTKKRRSCRSRARSARRERSTVGFPSSRRAVQCRNGRGRSHVGACPAILSNNRTPVSARRVRRTACRQIASLAFLAPAYLSSEQRQKMSQLRRRLYAQLTGDRASAMSLGRQLVIVKTVRGSSVAARCRAWHLRAVDALHSESRDECLLFLS